MTFNYKLINEILTAIFPLPEEFGVITDEYYGDEKPINFDLLYDLVNKVDKDAELFYGMSKLVISSPNFGGVVIKIPFNGYYVQNEEDDDDNLCWRSFYFAEAADSSDYCLSEYEKYQKLKKLKLHCFVTKTILYKILYGVRVFLQEYAITENNDYEVREASHKSQKLADEWYKQRKFYCIDSEWVANCLDYYGESKTKKFLEYCNNVDSGILADAHCGNYGYRPNGTPCLLDFSDFLD